MLQHGVLLVQAALDTAVQSDKAPALFEGAADKFQEVSAHGACNFPLFVCMQKRMMRYQ
jgi:hypothetical protein